jgi:hypothetical protein
MKKIFIILFVLSFSGCVAERQGAPAVAEVEIPKCPGIIKAAAKNLEDIGVDKGKVLSWTEMTLALRIQPCNLCQRVTTAVYVLKDEKGIYKPAMIQLMQAVEKSEPNTTKPNAARPVTKQKEDFGNTLKNKNIIEENTEAKKYLEAADELQAFLMDELRFPRDDAQNFISDHFFIPLMTTDENTAQTQTTNN